MHAFSAGFLSYICPVFTSRRYSVRRFLLNIALDIVTPARH